MSYGDFTLTKVKKELGVEIIEGVSLFGSVAPIAASVFLVEALRRYGQLATLVNTLFSGRKITIAEAKNESIPSGLGQCMAEMVAAQIFNEREGQKVDTIYGAVTTGTNWQFLRLIDSQIWIDDREYFINEIDHIFGILTLPFLELPLLELSHDA